MPLQARMVPKEKMAPEEPQDLVIQEWGGDLQVKCTHNG